MYNFVGPRSSNGRTRKPLVMLVDDAQWADQPSLRFLAYLAQRIADLPIALVVTVREGELASDRQALAALSAQRPSRTCCAPGRSATRA